MNRLLARLAPSLFLASALAGAQITTVPMKGVGNEWVKELDLKGRMDWEWIETYPEQVYFATRHDATRKGDIVTMWTRVEYKHGQSPLDHKSAVSKDDWDCAKRQRSTASTAARSSLPGPEVATWSIPRGAPSAPPCPRNRTVPDSPRR